MVKHAQLCTRFNLRVILERQFKLTRIKPQIVTFRPIEAVVLAKGAWHHRYRGRQPLDHDAKRYTAGPRRAAVSGPRSHFLRARTPPLFCPLLLSRTPSAQQP